MFKKVKKGKKTMKKRVLAIAATAMATMMMATPVLAEDYKIGICNYVDDASLNQIVDNLESRLKEIGKEKDVNFNVSYDNCNADANVMEQIISDFQADGVDLMVGVATPVAMRMQASTEGTDTPVVFSAVSDPVGAGLVESLEAPGANLTGTSDYLDTASIMKLIEAVNPDTKKIGLLYDIGQDSSTAAIEAAKAYMDENGIEYVERTGTTTDEVQLAADALVASAAVRPLPLTSKLITAVSGATAMLALALTLMLGVSGCAAMAFVLPISSRQTVSRAQSICLILVIFLTS